MAKRYILQAFPIDEIFTLIEAVYWAAFRFYPCSLTLDVEVPESISVLSEKNFGDVNFVVPQEAYPGSDLRRVNFMREPEHPYVVEPAFYENFKLGEPSPDDQRRWDDEYAQSRDAWGSYRADMLIWRDWYEANVAPFQHEIFQKLAHGELPLYGVRTFLVRHGRNPLEWEEHDLTGEADDYWDRDQHKQLSKIRPDGIRYRGIEWDQSTIQGPDGIFDYVHIR